MNIKQFHSQCINHTQRMFDEYQEVEPILFALKPDGDILLLARHFRDDSGKHMMYDIYALILAAEECQMYCFAAESWFSSHTKSKDVNIDDIDLSKVVRPMDDPDRKEAVLVITTTRDNRYLSNVFEIKTKNDQKYLSDHLAFSDGESMRDNLKLFDRFKGKNTKQGCESLKRLLDAARPDWYSIMPKERFDDVKVDA